MSTKRDAKLKKLLELHRPGTVLLASWLEREGISRELQKGYRRSGWLASVGTGAFRRPSEEVAWQGAVYALQAQAELAIHAGALTALSLQGFAHYVRLGGEAVYLFSPRGVKLPAWFKRHDWGVRLVHTATSVLPEKLGLALHEAKTFTLQISGPERAMLECLHLAPKKLDLLECFQVMQGLGNLRPGIVTELLKECTSVKAKRLFLYLAEKSGHQWVEFLDVSSVDLGRGARSFAKGGVHVPKYDLVVPQELAAG